MKFKILFFALLFSCFSWGQIVLANYKFESNLTPEAGSIGSPNLTFSIASPTYNAGVTGVAVTTGTAASANGAYVEVTMATTGYSNITISWAGRTSNATTPGSWDLTADSGSGFGSVLLSQTLTTAFVNTGNISMSTLFDNKSIVKFRLTANNPSLRNLRVDDLIISGTVSGPCTVPLNQASTGAFSNPLTNGATISWANGASTSGSMVVIRPTSATLLDPSTSSSYTPNANYASAAQIDVDNRVVYLGGGTSVNVTGLNPQTQYTATIYSYNALDCYNTTAPVSVNFYTLAAEPTSHSTLSCGAATSSSITLTFTAANTLGGDGYIILARIGAAPTGVPSDGNVYVAGTILGDATVIGYTDSLGTATSYVATGLNSSTAYNFSLIPFKQSSSISGTYNYRTAVTIPVCASTTLAATGNLTISNNGAQPIASNVPQGTTNLILSQLTLTASSANSTITGIANLTCTGSYLPSDILNIKVRYSTDAVLDVSDITLCTISTISNSGALQPSAGFSPNQTIVVGTPIYIFITVDIAPTAVVGRTIALNAVLLTSPANFVFSAPTPGRTGTTNACGTQTISPSAPAVPTAFTRVCTSNTTQSVTWAAPATGTFDGYLLVVRDGGVPNAVTTIVASSQAFNLNYSLAPTYNATTSRVLYVGTGTSATITGLTPGATYTYALYAYKNNGGSSIFSTTATTITQTATVPNVTGYGATPANASGTVTWNNPTAACYNEVIAVVTTAAGITFAPSGDGTAYIPNPVYSAPNQVVYNSSGNFVTITGLTNGVTYYIEIFVRIGTEWSTGVEVSFTPALATVFKPGELIFVGFDGQYVSSGPDDQYLVATMVDIIPGTTFSIANSRYEAGAAANVRTDKWGGAGNDPSTPPGVTNFTYNGSGNIPAGSVLVLNTNSSNVFSYEGVITGTTLTNRTADFVTTQPFGVGTTPNITTMNGDGEQIYLFQGNFVSDGTIDLTEANYLLSGTLLHGFTIKTGWVPLTSACSGTNGGGSNRQSRLPNALTCFNIESAVANTISGYYRNSAEHGSTSIRNIIKAVANVATNWVIGTTRYTIDATSSATNRAGKTFIIGTSESAGQWVGDADANWFNCANWGRLTLPDETIDVVVDGTTSVRDAVVDYSATYSDFYSDLALCKNLSILGRKVQLEGNINNKIDVYGNLVIDAAGSLDMDDTNAVTADGLLGLFGNWTNNGTESNFLQGQSTVRFKGSAAQVINNVAPYGTEIFYNVILDNDFDTALSNDLIATGDLTVISGKAVSVDSNGYIQVNKRLNSEGDFTIENSGQLIQVDETDTNIGIYTGTKFQVKRTALVKNLDYVYWSAPTAGFSLSSLPTNNRYEWSTLNPNSNGTLGNWTAPSTATMTKGRGYIARASNGALTPTALTTTFTGQPNNGQFTYQIYRGNYTLGDYDADLTNPNNLLTTAYDDNWNLVGNPYPSAIDAMEFINLNTATNNVKMVGAIWVWKHGIDPTSNISPFYQNFTYNYSTNDYIKFNAMGSSEPTMFTNGKIASGQGFMINMSDELSTGVPNPSGNTITFTNDLRTGAANAIYNNTDFFKSSNATVQQPEERHRIWLDLINTTSGQLDRNLLGYATNATLGKDNLYDCFTRPKSEISLYSLIDNKPYAIQGRPLPFDVDDVVPMGIKVVESGNHTIAINTVDGLFAQNQDIYLEDKLLSVIHNLKQAPYNFTSNIGVFNDRFFIRYTTNSALSTNATNLIENNVVVVTNNNQVTIKSVYENIKSVVIYDLLGREIVKKEAINLNEVIFNSITARNQALIVKIKLENDTIVTRKIML